MEQIESLIREHFKKKTYEFIPVKKKTHEFIPGITPILTGMAVFDDKEINAIVKSVLKGWFGLGKQGREFEEQFSKRIDRKYSAFVNSGSSANLLALNAIKHKLNLKQGEIIIPSCTFPTTLNPIIQLGFTPVFVDVDKTLNLTPEKVNSVINKNTVGILFGHTLGNPAKISEISKIAKENNLFLIEDCCDALGSKYDDKVCGSFGDLSTCSFYPAHIMTTGEGGMVSTNDSDLNRIVKSLRDWGKSCWCTTDEKNLFGACKKRFDFKINDKPYDHRYVYSTIGYNLKPLELQAAMGLEQLLKLDDFIKIRKRNFKLYQKEFLKFKGHLDLPEIYDKADPVFFGLPITIKNQSIKRQELLKFLNRNKIATRLLFGGHIIHQPAYKDLKFSMAGESTNSDNILENSLWIGLHPGISPEMIEYTCSKFKEFIEKL